MDNQYSIWKMFDIVSFQRMRKDSYTYSYVLFLVQNIKTKIRYT